MREILVIFFMLISVISSAQIFTPVIWEFSQKQISETEVELQFQAEIEEHWHMYSQFVEDEMIATKFTFYYNRDTIISKPEEGKPIKQYDPIWEMTLRYFEHKAIFKQKITVNSTSDIQLGGYVVFLVCDEAQCLPPDYSEFLFTIKGVEEAGEGKDALTFTQKNKKENN